MKAILQRSLKLQWTGSGEELVLEQGSCLRPISFSPLGYELLHQKFGPILAQAGDLSFQSEELISGAITLEDMIRSKFLLKVKKYLVDHKVEYFEKQPIPKLNIERYRLPIDVFAELLPTLIEVTMPGREHIFLTEKSNYRVSIRKNLVQFLAP